MVNTQGEFLWQLTTHLHIILNFKLPVCNLTYPSCIFTCYVQCVSLQSLNKFLFSDGWIQEIPENGADLNHLDHLHSSPILSGVDLRHIFSHWWQFARHNWSAEWKPHEDAKHVGCLQLVTTISVFGYKIPYLYFQVTARQVNFHPQFRYSNVTFSS